MLKNIAILLLIILSLVSFQVFVYVENFSYPLVSFIGNIPQNTIKIDELKIIVSVNDGFWDFFINWKTHANIVGIPNSDLIVIAEDDIVFQKLIDLGIKVFTPDNKHNSEAHVYNSKNYIKMVSKRPEYISSILDEYESDILYMDLDTVLIKDIRNIINRTHDMMFGVDTLNYKGVKNYYCTGIMYFKNNKNSKKVVDAWNKEITAKNQLNQPLFNKVIRRFDDVDHAPFDRYQVMSGQLWKKEGIMPQTYLVHANYIQGHDEKQKMMFKYDLWHSDNTKIAICTCVRSRKSDTSIDKTDLYKLLITSAEATITEFEKHVFDISVYVYFDDDDEFWKTNKDYDWSKLTDIPVKLYETKHTDSIPWNNVTMHAYNDGTEYIFRTNDDVKLQSKSWITMAVNALSKMNNIGVVGPKTLRGKREILTLDFTHRTHIDIFGFYYPYELKNWCVDDEITYIYGARTVTLDKWVALHVVNPTRYDVFRPSEKLYGSIMEKGRDLVYNFIKDSKVIVASNVPLKCSRYTSYDVNLLFSKVYFDYWVECTEPDDSVCQILQHEKPTLENKFLLVEKKYRNCKITHRVKYRAKSDGISEKKYISVQQKC